MANRPAHRNWNDVQIAIATISMAFTLAFWNLFAGPDRESAAKRAQEQAALPPPQPIQTTAAPVVEVQPQPTFQSPTIQGNGPILLGGSAPQTQIIVRTGGGGGGGGGGGSTRSS